MGKKSTRENKSIYQLAREEAGMTREEASEHMEFISDSRIEKYAGYNSKKEITDISRFLDKADLKKEEVQE